MSKVTLKLRVQPGSIVGAARAKGLAQSPNCDGSTFLVTGFASTTFHIWAQMPNSQRYRTPPDTDIGCVKCGMIVWPMVSL